MAPPTLVDLDRSWYFTCFPGGVVEIFEVERAGDVQQMSAEEMQRLYQARRMHGLEKCRSLGSTRWSTAEECVRLEFFQGRLKKYDDLGAAPNAAARSLWGWVSVWLSLPIVGLASWLLWDGATEKAPVEARLVSSAVASGPTSTPEPVVEPRLSSTYPMATPEETFLATPSPQALSTTPSPSPLVQAWAASTPRRVTYFRAPVHSATPWPKRQPLAEVTPRPIAPAKPQVKLPIVEVEIPLGESTGVATKYGSFRVKIVDHGVLTFTVWIDGFDHFSGRRLMKEKGFETTGTNIKEIHRLPKATVYYVDRIGVSLGQCVLKVIPD